MLNRYRLDLKAISPKEQEDIMAQVDGFTWTGFTRTTPGVYDCFIQSDVDTGAIVKLLPDGCTMTKL